MELLEFFSEYGSQLAFKTWEHLYISFIALFLGILVAVPLGILLSKVPKIAGFVMGIVGVVQTFPSLAILAFFIPLTWNWENTCNCRFVPLFDVADP